MPCMQNANDDTGYIKVNGKWREFKAQNDECASRLEDYQNNEEATIFRPQANKKTTNASRAGEKRQVSKFVRIYFPS